MALGVLAFFVLWVLVSGGVYVWLRTRAPKGVPPHAPTWRASAAAAGPPPPPPPPPSPEVLFGTAVRQACARAFTSWWRDRTTCPCCDAPGWRIHPRANEQAVEFFSPTQGRGGFISWTQAVSCPACGYRLEFPHTDAGPIEPVPLPTGEEAVVVRFDVPGADGRRAARVESGPGGVTTALVAGASPAVQGSASLIAAFLRVLQGATHPDVPADVRARVLRDVVRTHATLHGVAVRDVTDEAPA